MGSEKPGFINVEALISQVPLEQALAYYDVQLPEIHRIGNEVRMRCFLNCGRTEETGERAIAIQADHPAKLWRCHQSGCGRGGNLVSLIDLLKPGAHSEGKPRGDRFKAIIADLLAMVEGKTAAEITQEVRESPAAEAKPQKRIGNVPLAESPNERARGLTNLDEKFVVDVAHMTPKASAYFRKRPFLTPEMCRKWRMGYLPRDTGGDHAGGTMRGRIVYPMLSEEGEVLTWFGRDPEYEGKMHEWIVGGKQGREPEKYHFVKGFHRGLELFGQHHLRDGDFRQRAQATGLLVVPGANDVMGLELLGVSAVGVCATTVTAEQAEKLGGFSRQTGSIVTILFDCTEEGELAARVALVELARHCAVRLAWSQTMHGGAFKGRQPESLSAGDWREIRNFLDVYSNEGV